VVGCRIRRKIRRGSAAPHLHGAVEELVQLMGGLLNQLLARQVEINARAR
jgi:hypothetical protein